MHFLNESQAQMHLQVNDPNGMSAPFYKASGFYFCWISPPLEFNALCQFIECLVDLLKLVPCFIKVEQYRQYSELESLLLEHVWRGLGKPLELSGFCGQVTDSNEEKEFIGFFSLIVAFKWGSRLISADNQSLLNTQGEDNLMRIATLDKSMVDPIKELLKAWSIKIEAGNLA